MKLATKLFFSYLAVVSIGLAVVVLSVAFIAPVDFSHRMLHAGMGNGGMMRHGAGNVPEFAEQLDADFRESVNTALLLAGGTAILAAAAISWFISQQIVRPIRAMVTLSQRIAGGHYQERLQQAGQDEPGDLARSFNRMAQALEDTENMRRRLMADITHELKTPLAGIKGYMEALQDNVIPATPETFQLVHREADRLHRLVLDLQELSRTEAGQIVLQPRVNQPQPLVEAVARRLRPQFTEKDISLTIDCPDTLPAIYADADRTEQILTNLLGNALYYTPSGGNVMVRATPDGKMMCFSVQDSGIGLAQADLENIFQRFYRVDKSRSRAGGGSGIGLTIARYLVEAQHGTLHATSAGLNQGSTFSFTLPLANFTQTS